MFKYEVYVTLFLSVFFMAQVYIAWEHRFLTNWLSSQSIWIPAQARGSKRDVVSFGLTNNALLYIMSDRLERKRQNAGGAGRAIIGFVQSRKFKTRYGVRNQFQEPSLELGSQATYRLAGQYDNPMRTWFLAPIAGLKLPTQLCDSVYLTYSADLQNPMTVLSV
jgi:hypothetical protein